LVGAGGCCYWKWFIGELFFLDVIFSIIVSVHVQHRYLPVPQRFALGKESCSYLPRPQIFVSPQVFVDSIYTFYRESSLAFFYCLYPYKKWYAKKTF
jgi:hypothetical protein